MIGITDLVGFSGFGGGLTGLVGGNGGKTVGFRGLVVVLEFELVLLLIVAEVLVGEVVVSGGVELVIATGEEVVAVL